MSAPKDDSAERARQAEEERKARIAKGTANIENVFKAYDEPYYGTYRDQYTGFYQPELQDQYEDAYKQTVLNLNRTGGINTSAGAQALGRLQERLSKETSQITGRAEDYVAGQRANVENTRSKLLNQLYNTADPGAANQAALAESEMLNRQQTLNPLGAVFADLVGSVATGIGAERRGYQGFNTGLFDQKPGSAQRIIS